MKEFNEKNLFFVLLILSISIAVFYISFITHKKYKNHNNETTRNYMLNKNVYPGYLISISALIFSIYKLIFWAIE